VLWVASLARADTVSLALEAPAGCADRTSIERRALALSGTSDSPVHIEARAYIEAREDGSFRLRLHLLTGDRKSQRVLDARDCASLGEAAAWLIALAIDPDLSAQEQPPSEVQPARKAEQAASAAAVPPRAQAPHTLRWRAGVTAGLVNHGVVGAQGQLGAFAGLGKRWSYSELALSHVFARSRFLAEGGTARFSGQTLTLAQCAELGATLRVAPCIGAVGERTVGSARLVEGRERTVYWLQGAALLKLFYVPRAPLELSVQGFLTAPVTGRPRFHVEGLGAVAQASFISYGMSLAVGTRY
jgi:hypothetical protein